jgi:hypothetical protein
VNTGLPERDERTQAVENAGYRWSYYILTYGVLGAAGYRSLVLRETAWDLLALVVLGGVVNTVYQASRRILYPRWLAMGVVTLLAAAALAAAMAFFLRLGR